jgi:hypothetical protein
MPAERACRLKVVRFGPLVERTVVPGRLVFVEALPHLGPDSDPNVHGVGCVQST